MTITTLTAAVSAPAQRGSWRGLVTRWPLTTYFVLAFAGSWLMLLPAALSQGTHGLGILPVVMPDEGAFVLTMLSAYTGPLLAGLLVTAAVEGRSGLRDLRRSIGRWRVSPVWYAVVLVGPAAIWLTAYSLAMDGLPFQNLMQQWSLVLTTFLPLVLIGLLLPSLGEETGWRGVALPRLQRRFHPVAATLVLGGLHSLWHLPAFFTVGLGPFAGPRFAAFVLTGIAATFLYTWVFNNARGSVLLAILLHASFNAAASFVGALIPPDAPVASWAQSLVTDGWLNVLAFGVVALVLVIVTRGRLGYRPPQAE